MNVLLNLILLFQLLGWSKSSNEWNLSLKENTIYEVNSDIDLKGKTITIPQGCTIIFKRGKIANGKVIFKKTTLQGKILIDAEVEGMLTNEEVIQDLVDGANQLAKKYNAFVLRVEPDVLKSDEKFREIIIQKGFTIVINGDTVAGNRVELLVQKDNNKTGLRPYIFTGKYGSVNVKLAIGFYAPMASEDDIDEMNESERKSSEAGITVVCNDRVVLYNDKTNLTGWGTNGVPNYHTQFIGIKGIVIFESNIPSELPMTTTKRGIDHSSSVYITIKDKICEGLKMFTNYTNQWKGRNTQERCFSSVAQKTDYSELFSDNSFGIQLRSDARSGGETYKPSLPRPENDKPYRIIRFSKSTQDIQTLVGFFYGDPEEDISPSLIGEKCFDKVLSEAKMEV